MGLAPNALARNRFLRAVLIALGLASANGCTGGNGAAPDAGEQPINYTFDHGTEGWVLNKREGTSATNLGLGVPDGASPPSVSFSETDGEPSPGSLRLTVTFTAPWQLAAAGVAFGQARDLSGKTLHALVRLVSGTPAGVWAGLYACGTGRCVDEAVDAGNLAEGAWAPLALDLGAADINFVGTLPGPPISPSIVELGIEVYTTTSADGGTPDGGAFSGAGELVFEIDTVTD
jgi:hypothetical protein